MAVHDAREPCPVCRGPLLARPEERGGATLIACSNCGVHALTREALEDLPTLAADSAARARVAHGVVQLPEAAVVTTDLLHRLVQMTELPGAMERIDKLVLHLADLEPGEVAHVSPKEFWARLGCATSESAAWVIEEARKLGYIAGGQVNFALTATGWQRQEELLRKGARSHHAFMAMKFGDAELDRVFAECLRPAVGKTGFELRKLAGDHQTAGSIDNRMRVEIRTSRFLVCDLTHGNRGAYWEAGFAEGLGRPVFYTCRRAVLEDRTHVDHPHFDAAHQLIIKWDLADLDAAARELKSAIRATLPAEATLEDG